jgi:hypothetical protein
MEPVERILQDQFTNTVANKKIYLEKHFSEHPNEANGQPSSVFAMIACAYVLDHKFLPKTRNPLGEDRFTTELGITDLSMLEEIINLTESWYQNRGFSIPKPLVAYKATLESQRKEDPELEKETDSIKKTRKQIKNLLARTIELDGQNASVQNVIRYYEQDRFIADPKKIRLTNTELLEDLEKSKNWYESHNFPLPINFAQVKAVLETNSTRGQKR